MNNSKNTLENAIKLATPMLTQLQKGDELNKISEMLGMIRKAPVTLLVCGEFKRGKSTFVNALIGRDLCATDTDICTSVVSIIKYGEKENVKRYYGDFSDVKEEEIKLDELEDYTVGTAEEINNTLAVEIELPLEALKSGLVVIDTPGVGGLDPRHAALTNYYLPRADVAIMITDVNEPMTTTELAFLKDKVVAYTDAFMVVVNKADLKDSETVESYQADTVKKISENLEIDEDGIYSVTVSSAAEAYPDNDLGESNFDELKKMIGDLVAAKRKKRLEAVTANFMELIDLAVAPMEEAIAEIEQPDVDRVAKLNGEIAAINSRLAVLADPNSDFRNSINKILTSKREEVNNEINEFAITLQSMIFPKLLEDPNASLETGGEWLGQRINDAITEEVSKISNDLNNVFEEIAGMEQFGGVLNYEIKEYNGSISVRRVDNNVPMYRRITPAMSGVGIMTMSAVWLAAVAPWAIAIGVGIGAYVAYSNVSDSKRGVREQRLRQVYQPQLSGSISSIHTYVNTRFQEFQTEWLKAITDRAKNYKESLKATVEEVQKVKQDINQAMTKKIQLQNKIKPLISAREIVGNSLSGE